MRTRAQVVDEMLVLAAQARHSEAFERLAVRWHPRLLRHALRLTGDSEGSREAVQEAWVGIVRGLWRLQDPARFGAWALRITRRRCADWIARRQQVRERTTGLTAAEHAATAAVSDRDAQARQLLCKLEPAQKPLVAMFYLEGLTVAEIGEVLGLRPGTVKSRLFKARCSLRATLEVDDDTTNGR